MTIKSIGITFFIQSVCLIKESDLNLSPCRWWVQYRRAKFLQCVVPDVICPRLLNIYIYIFIILCIFADIYVQI